MQKSDNYGSIKESNGRTIDVNRVHDGEKIKIEIKESAPAYAGPDNSFIFEKECLEDLIEILQSI